MSTDTSDIVRTIGKRLKKAREEKHLTLDEAAKLALLSPEHLDEMEKGFEKPEGGRKQGPTLVKLERVANVYGVSVRLERDS